MAMFGMIPIVDPETGKENAPEDLCTSCSNFKKIEGVFKCRYNFPLPEKVELEFEGVIEEINWACEGCPV